MQKLCSAISSGLFQVSACLHCRHKQGWVRKQKKKTRERQPQFSKFILDLQFKLVLIQMYFIIKNLENFQQRVVFTALSSQMPLLV